MHVTLIDDSIPFDPRSADTVPLGGVEKAFLSLAQAFAARGHTVQVFNRAPARVEADGAVWEGWEAARPERSDVVIAHRRPALLDQVPEARIKMLWVPGTGGYLEKERNRSRLLLHKPITVFSSRAAIDGWDNEFRIRLGLIAPGVRAVFREGPNVEPADPPRAIVTAHPLHGLSWLVRLWRAKIRPVVPRAELHVYSGALYKGVAGEPVAPAFEDVLRTVQAADEDGVIVQRPLDDPAMAGVYRSARVHLHPGVSEEVYCYTLSESQACGLPAVARPKGGVRSLVVDDTSGLLANEDDAFAIAALRVLNDQKTFDRLALGARSLQRDRDWDGVASEFEALWA